MKKPNFFIIGAPKCGTTSLANWLSQHHDIFMSSPKEPHFFNTDSTHRGFKEFSQYEKLFENANSSDLAVGEASVWYLASNEAVRNILEYQPEAKFIVCIRNPVEMAISLHDQKKFSGEENIDSFWDAWNIQESRQNGQNLPYPCADPMHLQYGQMCSFGHLIKKLLEQVSNERVLFVFMDDMKSNPKQVYTNTLNFLNIKDDERDNFPVINTAKQRKILWIRKLSRIWFLFKQKTGVNITIGLGGKLDQWNLVERKRNPLAKDKLDMIRKYFDSDIKLLSEITGRELSHW